MRTALLFFCLLAIPPSVSVRAAEAERAAHTAFKGIELYSWKDAATGSWHFSLLPGTNRNKTATEITTPSQMIADVYKLEQHLARLAKGEQVFWSSPNAGNFAFPPTATIDTVVKYAATCDVKVAIQR